MKTLFLILVVGFLATSFAQDIPIIGDTTDLKSHTRKQVVILTHFGGGDETGGGLFRRIDSTYAEGTNAFDYEGLDGLQWARIGMIEPSPSFNNDVTIDGSASGLDMQGAYTSAAIDLTDVVLNHSGSSGPVMIRAGTYGSPVSSSDPHQSGMIRLYGSNDAATDDGTGFYDRGLFAYLRTDKAKGIFPIAGLAEVRTTAGDGPTDVMAAQFIADLNTTGAKLNDGGFGMFGAWLKITAKDGATTVSGTVKAPLWLDNQMYGNNAAPGEEYTIFATTGGLRPDAFVGFETTSSGWDYMWYFDETAYDQAPVSSITPATQSNDSDGSIIINLNGTDYYIPYFGIGKD